MSNNVVRKETKWAEWEWKKQINFKELEAFLSFHKGVKKGGKKS